MRLFRSVSALSLLLLAACSQEVPTDEVPAPVEQNEQQLAPKAEAPAVGAPNAKSGRHARKGRHGGPGFLLRAALNELELRPEQKTTIEALTTELESAQPFASPAHAAFDKALAAQVRAGKIDRAALEPHTVALEKSASDARLKVQGALGELHRTLDTEQRKALVATIEARMSEGKQRFGPMKHDGECAADGECAGEGECKGASGGHGKRGFGRGHGPKMGGHHGPGFGTFAELDLSDAQRDQLRAAREKAEPDRAAMKEKMQQKGDHMKQLLAAFAADGFDAKKLSDPPGQQPRTQLELRVKQLETMLAVLDPAQRVKLASGIESGPPGRKH